MDNTFEKYWIRVREVSIEVSVSNTGVGVSGMYMAS